MLLIKGDNDELMQVWLSSAFGHLLYAIGPSLQAAIQFE